jgi:DNA-binding MarR family transcriptional regulator
MPVRLSDFDLEKDVSDDELVSAMSEKWRNLSFQPLDSSDSKSVEATQSVEVQDSIESEQREESEVKLSEEAERLLKDIVDNPFKSVTERYESFSSRYKGDKAKKELLEKDLVEEENASVDQGRVKLFELTDIGEEFLEEIGVDVVRTGRGGVVHRYWQHRVSELLEERDLNPVIEKSHADVFVNQEGEAVAIEIAMGRNERELEHVSDRVDQGFDRVLTLCKNSSVKGFIEDRIDRTAVSEDSVDIRLLREFLDDDSLL